MSLNGEEELTMQNILSKKTGVATLILVTMLLTLYAFSLINREPSSPSKIVYISPSHVTDVSNDRKLAGIADNLFVGEVKAQLGNKKLDKVPESQFKVEVIQNIKGTLNGVVTVNQQGGNDDGSLILVEGDSLLEVGKTYLFATRVNQEQKWNTLVPVYGDILVNNDIKKKDLIDRFTKAHKEEIPFMKKA